MGRPKRTSAGGLIYHVLNRANARMRIFEDAADYEVFERVLTEAVERVRMRLLAYCVMPNHWHLVLRPRADGDLSRFAGWLTLTHTQRRHAHRHTAGSGHLFQGRFKSFVVESDEHFYTLVRHVEPNSLRAALVERAEQWRWSSLWRRGHRDAAAQAILSDWPIERPPNWLERVNEPLTAAELKAIRRSIQRGSPFGSKAWARQTAERLDLESTLRPRGRPRNGS